MTRSNISRALQRTVRLLSFKFVHASSRAPHSDADRNAIR